MGTIGEIKELFPLIKLAKKLKGWNYNELSPEQKFPLIKLAKKLKGVIDWDPTPLNPKRFH